MKPRNKTKKLALLRSLRRARVPFEVSMGIDGAMLVTVFMADSIDRTEIYGSLGTSWSGGGISYHLNWGDFEAAVAAAIEEAKREG